MKSINRLFDEMIDVDYIKRCIYSAAQGKSTRQEVKYVMMHLDAEAKKISRLVRKGRWDPPHHVQSMLREGPHKKERIIIKPRWKYEQIIHHMLIGCIKMFILKRLYRHVYGSVPGRGTHGACKTIKRWVSMYGKKHFYVAELDIRKFYENVDHDILKTLLKKNIRDKRYLELMFKIIDACPKGLPLGNYTSPWLANYYLIGMDNYILQELKPDHYLRYMDNLYLFHTNKRKLHRAVSALRDWVGERRNLQIKDNWQVFRFEDSNGKGRAINALGFVVHRGHVSIRKTILKRIRKKARKIKNAKYLTYHDACSYISRLGYIKGSDTYGYFQDHLKDMVSIKACKKRIAKESRAKAKIYNNMYNMFLSNTLGG